MGQSDRVRNDERLGFRNNKRLAPIKKGGLGATPAFAAAPNRPFFQDNLLNNQSYEISKKFFH
jgi:hypothetical protein